MINLNTKLLFGVGSVLALLSGCMIVNAVAPLFSETLIWNLPHSSITVNGKDTSTSTINLGVVTGDPLTVTYDVVNNGNVPLTVEVAVSASGCSASLNATSTTLEVDESAQFVLTLTTFTADGQCVVTFSKATV